MYIQTWIDLDDILSELDDDELIEILNDRNYDWDAHNDATAPGIFIPAKSLGDVYNYAAVLDAAGITYNVIK